MSDQKTLTEIGDDLGDIASLVHGAKLAAHAALDDQDKDDDALSVLFDVIYEKLLAAIIGCERLVGREAA